jgi:hypothetical protein
MAPYNQESPVSRSWDSGLCNIGLGLASPVKSGMGTAGSYKRIHWPGTTSSAGVCCQLFARFSGRFGQKVRLLREKKIAAFFKNYNNF